MNNILGAAALVACTTCFAGAMNTATAADTPALPALGSAAARDLPAVDSGATIEPGPDASTLHLDRWVPYYPPHSPYNDPQAAAAVEAAGSKLPTWSATVSSLGKTYKFSMAGASPLGKGAGTTKVKVVVIPVKFVFNNATFDATKPFRGCSSQGATAMLAQSPLVLSINFTTGGINVGHSQYIDLFQRANFWGYVQGNNPKYHTLFSMTQGPLVTVRVNGNATAASCTAGGNGAFGTVDNAGFDSLLRTKLIPSLSKYINPGVLPLFLGYDVVFGGAAGYHSAYATAKGTQTYAVSTYLDLAGDPPDVEVLSHEMGEFLDDPFVNNPTPAWGHIGQVTGCQSNLEVGDPLTGMSFGSVRMPNGFTYTVQDLAFFSWFYRGSPSFGVSGQYTMLNFFRNPPPLCH